MITSRKLSTVDPGILRNRKNIIMTRFLLEQLHKWKKMALDDDDLRSGLNARASSENYILYPKLQTPPFACEVTMDQ